MLVDSHLYKAQSHGNTLRFISRKIKSQYTYLINLRHKENCFKSADGLEQANEKEFLAYHSNANLFIVSPPLEYLQYKSESNKLSTYLLITGTHLTLKVALMAYLKA